MALVVVGGLVEIPRSPQLGCFLVGWFDCDQLSGIEKS
jgi:hypothetical protein